MRVVLDTSVVVSALRSRRGASNVVLQHVAAMSVKPVVTTALFLEYEEVLLRPEHRLATGMSETDVDGFLAALASACEPAGVHFRWRPQLADPSDELVLEAVVNGHVESLVTHNVRDFREAASGFEFRVITPQQLLKEMKS